METDPALGEVLAVPYQNIESEWELPLMHIAKDLGWAGKLSEPSSLVTTRHGDRMATKAGHPTFYTGFRCAFPPTNG